MKDDFLLNLIEDRYRKFQRDYCMVTTDFLDVAQQSEAAAFVRAHRSEGVFFFGGYEAAERKKIFFVPDYLGIENEEELESYLRQEDAAPTGRIGMASAAGNTASGPRGAGTAADGDAGWQTTATMTVPTGDSPIAVLEIYVDARAARLSGRGRAARGADTGSGTGAGPGMPRHSDYLGALMALGIKREKTGDILVLGNGGRSDGDGSAGANGRTGGSLPGDGGRPGVLPRPEALAAQIIVASEIAPYLEENYTQVGRVPLTARAVPLGMLRQGEIRMERINASAASPRLDNMVSAAFGVSRKDAAEAISSGLVFVDSMEIKKTDFILKGGEKLVLRGKGKAVYRGRSGTSKKGKLRVEFDRFL